MRKFPFAAQDFAAISTLGLEFAVAVALGTAAGIIIGITVCVLQQQLGLITFGNAEQFLSQPYPVVIRFTDILATAALVGALGLLAAYYPARQTTKDTSEHA